MDLEVVRAALTNGAAEKEVSLRERDRRIAELVVENVVLRRQMEEMTSSRPDLRVGRRAGSGDLGNKEKGGQVRMGDGCL